MTILEKFNATYQVYSMNRNSLTLMKNNGSIVLIHRSAYNALLRKQCEDFREVEREFYDERGSPRTMIWVEVLVWISR